MVKKRRAGHTPEGSGVAVGTEYRWFILAHQVVRKLNANDYDTSMTGVKYKISHKGAKKISWSETSSAQRKKLVSILKQTIEDLQAQTQK